MKLLKWLLGVIVVAAITHGALLYFGPSLIMGQVMGRVAARDGYNVMTHAPRPNAANNTIVRSSPDLLYSICPYDLTDGSLRILSEVPRDTYWSMSFYDMNTDNYRVINDSQATAGAVLIVLRKTGNDIPEPVGAEVIDSPTERGIVLIRTLINDESKLAEIDKTRRLATCRSF